jgi:hypothetical protein
MARKLHRAYSSTRGHYYAMNRPDPSSEWSRFVPIGSPWVPPAVDETSQPDTTTKNPRRNEANGRTRVSGSGDEFKGDRTLANSIAFIRDGILSREFSYATAEGDPGRVYDVMKVCT